MLKFKYLLNITTKYPQLSNVSKPIRIHGETGRAGTQALAVFGQLNRTTSNMYYAIYSVLLVGNFKHQPKMAAEILTCICREHFLEPATL